MILYYGSLPLMCSVQATGMTSSLRAKAHLHCRLLSH